MLWSFWISSDESLPGLVWHNYIGWLWLWGHFNCRLCGQAPTLSYTYALSSSTDFLCYVHSMQLLLQHTHKCGESAIVTLVACVIGLTVCKHCRQISTQLWLVGTNSGTYIKLWKLHCHPSAHISHRWWPGNCLFYTLPVDRLGSCTRSIVRVSGSEPHIRPLFGGIMFLFPARIKFLSHTVFVIIMM